MLNFKAFAKQAQKMQQAVEEVQEELSRRRVEVSSGGGMVRVVCDGLQNLVELKIDPTVVDPGDVEMLEDLIVAAVSEGRKAAQKLAADELAKVTGGMRIPGLF
ncbi:nucleoid-associated protein [candidate division TA06 bacterium DG_26]|uniref:Nucleoid-associated protein AMJ40_01245 n=1 Tax=candidate division TA06 bacterium DG_26 TaxID=1703771 RepID=A0A0S7WN16_UNCT6|nr:MAG: nucleoid-associated protein [candidate division TA06 bacterium DG_26]